MHFTAFVLLMDSFPHAIKKSVVQVLILVKQLQSLPRKITVTVPNLMGAAMYDL